MPRVARDDVWTVQGGQQDHGGRREGSGRSLYPTQLTPGLQDGCTQFLKAKLWALPARRTPWSSLHPLVPLADPISVGQK